MLQNFKNITYPPYYTFFVLFNKSVQYCLVIPSLEYYKNNVCKDSKCQKEEKIKSYKKKKKMEKNIELK